MQIAWATEHGNQNISVMRIEEPYPAPEPFNKFTHSGSGAVMARSPSDVANTTEGASLDGSESESDIFDEMVVPSYLVNEGRPITVLPC
jgi:hypothetical protein